MSKGFIPTFEIYAGGENVTARFQDRAVSILVELVAGGGSGDSVEIILDDRSWEIATPQVKDRLSVYLGYDGIGVAFMGTFEINSVRFSFPPKTISVRGTAASSLNDLKSQKIEAFEGKTVQEILAQAGSTIGMKVDIHPSIADQKIPFLNQTESFGSLIGRLESHYGAVAKIADGRVTMTPRSGGRSASDLSMPTYVFRAEHFADLEVLTESRGETAKTKASYFDKETNVRKFVETMSGLKGLDTEAQYTIGQMFNSKPEAEAAAKSVQAQLDRSTEKISAALAEGDPWVRDGQRIVVTDVRDGVNGSYLLDIVRHTYTKTGALRTTFSGQAGVDGLAQEFADSGPNDFSFIAPLPGQVFGQVLPQLDVTLLGQPFGQIPSLVGTPNPTTN